MDTFNLYFCVRKQILIDQYNTNNNTIHILWNIISTSYK
jgi:hypothetical protein